MKKVLFIFSVIFPLLVFSQDVKEPKEIYFEGIVENETMHDGYFYIVVDITKGRLTGETRYLYFHLGFDDTNVIICAGNADFDGSGSGEGKKINGKIIISRVENENIETGEPEIVLIYRPIELNVE